MRLGPHLTHAALQTRVAKIRADAHDEDYARMRWELDRLVDTLNEHLLAESPALNSLPEAARSVANDGQVRIRSALAALVRAAGAGAEHDDCESLAAELGELLELQDAVERKALRMHGLRKANKVEMSVRGVAKAGR